VKPKRNGTDGTRDVLYWVRCASAPRELGTNGADILYGRSSSKLAVYDRGGLLAYGQEFAADAAER
jgi:hypothetical protein